MLERVSAYIDRHQLLPAQGTIVVAVSGGADSLCLLHLLSQLCGPDRRYPDISLQAAHLNHMLRGEESACDAHAVSDLMQAWHIPLTLGEIDVLALAKTEKYSLEEAARLARYRFLREIARGKLIAVAHQADDQAETLLLHWLRGSGLSGLVGMSPRQQDIIRPLLEITRTEIVAYCQEHAIAPVEDASNTDPRFLRNRIRHELLPLLQELNPGITRTLLRNAEIARVDLAWLDAQVDGCRVRVVVSEQHDAIKLNVRALLAEPLSLQRHLLQRITAHLCAGQSPLELRHFLLIEQMLNEREPNQERALDLPQRLHILHTIDYLIIERLSGAQNMQHASPNQQIRNEETSLPLPGEVRVPGTAWLASAEFLTGDLARRVEMALRQEHWPEVWHLLEQPARYTVYVDGELIGPHLTVRTRRAGDRIQPLGMPGEKKVQDIFVDKHIARAERDTIPLFFSHTHCLWIAGISLDHRVRLTSRTRRIVRLSLHPV
jgi:tRNA(Ile)-lysidine synthase